MTTSNAAIATLESITGMSATTRQISYIAIVANRKANNAVRMARADHNEASNHHNFAVNNEHTDLSWATMGSVEFWEAQLLKADTALADAELFQDRIVNAITMVGEIGRKG